MKTMFVAKNSAGKYLSLDFNEYDTMYHWVDNPFLFESISILTLCAIKTGQDMAGFEIHPIEIP